MSARGMVIGRLLVFGCALVVMAFAAQRAQADPKPEAPPPSHSGSTQVQPVPAPNASGTSSSTSTQAGSWTSTQVGSSTATHVSPPVSSSSSAGSRAHVTAAPARARHQRHTARQQAARHQPPSLNSGWPNWLRDAAALDGLRSVGKSSSSSLLVAAGIALLLLVLAEASLLGLAGSRLDRTDARAPARPRSADEPLAIRRVQLRR